MCIKFKLLGTVVPDKSLTQISLCITLEWEMENRKTGKEGQINLSISDFFPTIHLATLNVYAEFEDSSSHRSREICDRKCDWRESKMDKQTQWQIGWGWFSFTQYKKTYPTFKSNFKILGTVFPVKFWRKFPICITWVRDGKIRKNGKKGKTNVSFLFFFPTQYFAILNVYTKFKDSGSHRSREICDMERKKNGQIKGRIRSLRILLHNTTSHIQHLYKISNFLGIVVPEKSLTKKVFTHTHTHTHHTHIYIYLRKRQNYIPLYTCTSYIGGYKNVASKVGL